MMEMKVLDGKISNTRFDATHIGRGRNIKFMILSAFKQQIRLNRPHVGLNILGTF